MCLRNTVTVSFSRPVSSMWLEREARGTSRQARTGPTRKLPHFLQGSATKDTSTGRWQQGGREGQAYGEEAEEGAGVT